MLLRFKCSGPIRDELAHSLTDLAELIEAEPQGSTGLSAIRDALNDE